jgi:hypothetical protein
MLPSFSGKLGQIKISSFDCARSSMDREYEYGSEGSRFEFPGCAKLESKETLGALIENYKLL